MEHEHHHHHHTIDASNLNRAFRVGILLNFVFVLVEVIAGLMIHSLSLLSDAGHNLTDVGGLALSLLGFRLLKVKSSDTFTYGYKKTSILVALMNAVILLASMGAILYAAIQRFIHPQPLQGNVIAIVAGIGIIINTTTALLFMRDKEKDLNVKSAYLHLLSDAFVSAGLVVGGILIQFTGWSWIDPLLSFIIAIIILYSTWNLLKDSLRLSLDGVPPHIELDAIKKAALEIKGIKEIHHIHVWAISTTENALTAHVVFGHSITPEMEAEIKHEFRHELEHLNISHATLETEHEADDCVEKDC